MYRIAGTNEVLFEHEIEDHYEALLNDNYDLVNVCGHEYEAGRLLRAMDHHAFRGDMLEYADNMISSGEWEEVEG